MTTTDNRTVSKVNGATAELDSIDTILYIEEWSSCSGECPQCGGHNVEINNFLILTSNPPQSQLRCKDCKYYFSSDMFSRNTNKEIDDWPPAPQIGDWPPSPQVDDAPWWPFEQEPPSYSEGSPVGWICPKCGRCYAPYVSGCLYCNASEIKITY